MIFHRIGEEPTPESATGCQQGNFWRDILTYAVKNHHQNNI
jgi:hypothetical protein